jgi:uncharacterized protein (DUF1330 family)
MEKGPAGPIVMVNLLKFRAKAAYDSDKPEATQDLSGRQAYERYGQEVAKYLAEVGARLVWRGAQKAIVIGNDDQDWDEILCVRYPSREAFLKMAMSPGYNSIGHHRDAAIENSGLLCCEAGMAE